VSTLTVSAHDSYGNPLEAGGDLFLAEIVNPVSARTIIIPTDDGDGNYTVSFASGLAGLHSLRISLGAVDIFGSPFSWTVVASQVDPANCEIHYSSSVVAGELVFVIVTARDRFKNSISHESLLFRLLLPSLNVSQDFVPFYGQYLYSPVQSFQDPFLANFSVTESANYTTLVFLVYTDAFAGDVLRAISGSPFNFTAVPAIASTAACYAVGDGLNR
jgi:hypothetical protein